MGKFVDLTGRKFGRLTVIKRAEDYISPNGSKAPQWLCECECGNEIIVVGGRLTKKNGTKSCGCLQKERASQVGKNNKKFNTYDLSKEYGIGYTFKGEEFYFDLEDYDKIKKSLLKFDMMAKPIEFGQGIRILNQNLFEAPIFLHHIAIFI